AGPAWSSSAITQAPPDPRCSDDEGVILGADGRTRAVADHAYASMPPVQYAPPADRSKHLPRSREALCSGGELRVVMLGDSIVADPSRSRWQEYLAEGVGAHVTKVTAVRGSTGPLWYQEADRPYCYAARFEPDLLIL